MYVVFASNQSKISYSSCTMNQIHFTLNWTIHKWSQPGKTVVWTPKLYYTLCLRKSVETLSQWLVPKQKQQRQSEVHFRLEFDSTENHNYHSKKSWIPCCQTKWSTQISWFIVCLSSLIQNKESIDFSEANFYCGARHRNCY